MYKHLVTLAALVGISLFVVNALASTFYWYVTIPWFDMLMHAIGGVFVALLGGAFLRKQLRGISSYHMFINIALFVFIIGLAWEYYEYVVQYFIKHVQLADPADSISDLICDMLGGIVGAGFVILLNTKYNRS